MGHIKTLISTALLCLLLPTVMVAGKVAYWGGVGYTQQSFSRASSGACSCRMCRSLRAQWRTPTTAVTTYSPAYARTSRSKATTLQAGQPVRNTAKVATRVATAPIRAVKKMVQRVRYRTEMRQRTRQVKRCSNGRCYFTNETYWAPVEVAYVVRVPADEEEPAEQEVEEAPAAEPIEPIPDPSLQNTELQSTPKEAVAELFKVIHYKPGDIFVDLGAGDGRLLETASSNGLTAIGVELDQARVLKTRKRLKGRATIVQADVRDFSVKYADVVYMWLYPNLMDQLELPDTATIVSYNHRFEGAVEVPLKGHTFWIRKPLRIR